MDLGICYHQDSGAFCISRNIYWTTSHEESFPANKNPSMTQQPLINPSNFLTPYTTHIPSNVIRSLYDSNKLSSLEFSLKAQRTQAQFY